MVGGQARARVRRRLPTTRHEEVGRRLQKTSPGLRWGPSPERGSMVNGNINNHNQARWNKRSGGNMDRHQQQQRTNWPPNIGLHNHTPANGARYFSTGNSSQHVTAAAAIKLQCQAERRSRVWLNARVQRLFHRRCHHQTIPPPL